MEQTALNQTAPKPNLSGLDRFLSIPFHSLLLFVWPVLRLFSANADQLPLQAISTTLLFAVAGWGWLFFALRLLLKNAEKASLCASGFALGFFFYGSARDRLLANSGPAFELIQWFVWGACAVFICGSFAIVLRSRRPTTSLTALLNIFALVLSISTTYSIFRTVNRGQSVLPKAEILRKKGESPDIYYIILDGYALADNLERYFNFDNSSFISDLERRGFFVAQKSRSNYMRTPLSLASSLNMGYLDDFRPSTWTNTRSWLRNESPLRSLIEFNRVGRSLKAIGYQYDNLPSGHGFSNSSRMADKDYGSSNDLVEFRMAFARTTMLAPWISDSLTDMSAQDLLRLIADLGDSAQLPSPKFVFAHILSPHPPYQFKADGSPAPAAPRGVEMEWGNHDGYVEQAKYLNTLVLKSIDKIMRESKTPPIIVIQGDHGACFRNETLTQSSMEPMTNDFLNMRSGILNAYLVPKGLKADIPDDISPVNTFRVLLRKLFDAQTPNLPTRVFESPPQDIFNLSAVPASRLGH